MNNFIKKQVCKEIEEYINKLSNNIELDPVNKGYQILFLNTLYKVIRNLKKCEKLYCISIESIFYSFCDFENVTNMEVVEGFLNDYLEKIKYPELRRLQKELRRYCNSSTKMSYSFAKKVYIYSVFVSYLEGEILNKDDEKITISDDLLKNVELSDLYDFYENDITDKTTFNLENPEDLSNLMIDFLT